MKSHIPANYVNPFELVAKGIENEHVYTKKSDVLFQDQEVTAFISAGQWHKTKRHVLIIPNEHFENIYKIPDPILARIHSLSARIAIAMTEAYGCDGIAIRQNNEPAGGQDVWHYHVHVIPRYDGDDFRHAKFKHMPETERKKYAEKLRPVLERILGSNPMT